MVGKEDSVNDQCDGDWLDTDRHRVILFKRAQLVLNLIINHTMRRLPGVLGPHLCEFLCNGKEGFRNYFSPNGSATGRNSTASVFGNEHLQVGDSVRDISKGLMWQAKQKVHQSNQWEVLGEAYAAVAAFDIAFSVSLRSDSNSSACADCIVSRARAVKNLN